jgi:Peptidase_C39 like family
MPEPSLIPIHHCQQIADGYCLPACTQMVLAALGIEYTQESLSKLLGTDPEAGTTNLARQVPVITLIDTADLSYWNRATLHAVVVVGTDQDAKTIWLHDPY